MFGCKSQTSFKPKITASTKLYLIIQRWRKVEKGLIVFLMLLKFNNFISVLYCTLNKYELIKTFFCVYILRVSQKCRWESESDPQSSDFAQTPHPRLQL